LADAVGSMSWFVNPGAMIVLAGPGNRKACSLALRRPSRVPAIPSRLAGPPIMSQQEPKIGLSCCFAASSWIY